MHIRTYNVLLNTISLHRSKLLCVNVCLLFQWIFQIKTHDGKEFMIQAPDEKSRTEWCAPIEECIRRLDPTKVLELGKVTNHCCLNS